MYSINIGHLPESLKKMKDFKTPRNRVDEAARSCVGLA